MSPFSMRMLSMSMLLLAGGGSQAVAANAAPAAAPKAPGSYVADPAHSTLTFSGTQAGAAFKGVFKKFTASVQLDPAAPASGHIDVRIDTNSVDTQDAERDGNIRGADFFNVAHNPLATYVTRSITKTATGYAAVGTLTLRGVSREVPLEFQFAKTPAGATLTGTAAVKRLDFGVGQGEWKSTEWVGNDVKIGFSLDLKPAS